MRGPFHSAGLIGARKEAERQMAPLYEMLRNRKVPKPKRLPTPKTRFEVHEGDTGFAQIHTMNSRRAADRLVKGLFESYACVDGTTPQIKIVQIVDGRRKTLLRFAKGANL